MGVLTSNGTNPLRLYLVIHLIRVINSIYGKGNLTIFDLPFNTTLPRDIEAETTVPLTGPCREEDRVVIEVFL